MSPGCHKQIRHFGHGLTSFQRLSVETRGPARDAAAVRANQRFPVVSPGEPPHGLRALNAINRSERTQLIKFTSGVPKPVAQYFRAIPGGAQRLLGVLPETTPVPFDNAENLASTRAAEAKVLLVDDDPAVLRVTRRRLER